MKDERIKKALLLLKNSNDSGYKISKATGLTEASISNWRRGVKEPSLANANILIQYFEPIMIAKSDASSINNPIILNVPLVSQYAQAGYLSGYADPGYMDALPTIPYIVDHEALGNYVAFEVKGDSMDDGTDDAIKEGDRLLCREIRPDLWAESRLHFRKWDFVIVHEEGILVKRIIDHDVARHTITIHSLNSFYPDKVIDLADVKQIFNVIELQRPRRR